MTMLQFFSTGTPLGRNTAGINVDTGELVYNASGRSITLTAPVTRTANPGLPFYVTATGAGSGDGTSWDNAASSIQAAVDLCESDRGDVVYITPGSYNENVVIDSKNYVTLVGVVLPGYARPDVVPDAGIALTVTASQGVVAVHMRFASADDDCVYNEGNGFLFQDCVFDGALTSAKGGLRLRGNDTDDSYTASEGVVDGCLVRGNAIGVIFDTAEDAVGVGETDDTIMNCKFIGNTIDIATKDTGTVSTYSIQNGQIGPGNVFADKNKTTYIDLTTTNGGAASDQTGTIVGNYFAADAIDTTAVKMVGTGFTFAGNLDTVGVVDGSGLD